jgi:hypothetical protein
VALKPGGGKRASGAHHEMASVHRITFSFAAQVSFPAGTILQALTRPSYDGMAANGCYFLWPR